MKIPNKIKIGESEYKIKEKLWLFDDKSKAGQIIYGNLDMKIRSDMTDRGKQDAFFHEVTHGLLKELEFNHPKITHFRNNEEFIQEMALLLRKTFLDLMEKQAHKN